MAFLERFRRAVARLNRRLGSEEGTTAGDVGGIAPGLRHLGVAERQEFPPEEFSDEQEESE